MFAGHRDDSQPHLSPLNCLWRIEVKNLNRPKRIHGSWNQAAIKIATEVRVVKSRKRIGDRSCILDCVTGTAGVNKVLVVQFLVRLNRLRFKVIQFKVTGHTPPSFPSQAVNATETKLIAQPVAKGLVVCVAIRPMATAVALLGIVENQR